MPMQRRDILTYTSLNGVKIDKHEVVSVSQCDCKCFLVKSRMLFR